MNIEKANRWLMMLVFALMPLSLLAQTIDVKGVVVDVTGEPMPGATVKVKGTTQATMTDIDGAFKP